MKVQWVKVSDVDTRVHTWGGQSRDVVVCIHGLGGTALSFIEIAEQLRSHYHVVSITIPGSAGTPSFPNQEGYLMRSMVAWLEGVIFELGLTRFSIIGHSWGAQVGLFYLNSHGDKVEKCILIDGGYYERAYVPNQFSSIDEEIAALIESDNQYMFDSIEEYLVAERQDAGGSWSSSAELAALDRIVKEQGKIRWHIRNSVTEWALRGIYKDEASSIYNSIRRQRLGKKLMLLQATLPANRVDRDTLAARFKAQTGGQVLKMPRCGHSMHTQAPEIVSDCILRHLNGARITWH